MSSLIEAAAVRDRLLAAFADSDIVIGIGLVAADDGFGVRVNFSRDPGSVHLPEEIDGVDVETLTVGPVTAHSL